MTEQTVTVSRETARVLYDVIVGSLDWGSGFLDSDEMRRVQELARAIGDVPLVRCRDRTKDDPPNGVKWAGYESCTLPMGHRGGHEYDVRPVCVVDPTGWIASPTRLPATGDRWAGWYQWPRSLVQPSYESLA